MTIGPRVKLFFIDGARKRANVYNRPEALYVKVPTHENPDNLILFVRCGADEYREATKKDREVLIATENNDDSSLKSLCRHYSDL